MLEPEKLVAAHLGGFLEEKQGGLTQTLKSLEEENEKLAGTIRKQQGDIDPLIRALEALIEDIHKAAEMVQFPEIDYLKGETRSMHDELRGNAS